MNNAEKLRKLTFGDESYFEYDYNFIPTAIQHKRIVVKPTRVRLRYATEEDIPFLFSFIEEYNNHYGIVYDDELKEDITNLVTKEGMFIILEGSKGFFGTFFVTITECDAPIQNYKVGNVVNISNLILTKSFIDNGSVYMETYAAIMERILSWGIFDLGCIFNTNIFISGKTAFTVWQHIANTGGTLFVGESDDNFNTVVIAVDRFIKDSRGLKTLVCRNIYNDDFNKICNSCDKALREHFNETQFSLEIGEKLPSEDMSFFLSGLYKHEPTISIALDSLVCNDITRKIEDRSLIMEQKEKNGHYFPLVINCNREVVANKVTYWILKEQGVDFVDCIIE